MKKQIKIKKFKKSGLISACPMKFASGASKYFIGVIFLLIGVICVPVICVPQNVGINQPNPDPSALLELTSDSMGILIPRITSAQMNAIASPATGLLIYNTECKLFFYYNGSNWIAFGNNTSIGTITGNTTPCLYDTSVVYSISSVTGATTYTWTVPTGASVASGQGDTSITVNFGNICGNVCVTTDNCGESVSSCLIVTLTPIPNVPAAIAATNSTQTSFDANWNGVQNATNYYLDVSTVSDFSSYVTGYNNLDVNNVITYSVTVDCDVYYYRVRAGNNCDTSYNSNTIGDAMPLPPTPTDCGTVTDVDGNIYNTVVIGTQCWMKENLKTTQYKNSTAIPNITADATWTSDVTGAYCCYNNDCPTYNATYGKLYNWYAVNNANGICPTGWHVPTHDEWTDLEIAICISGTCATDFPYDASTTGWRGTDEGGRLKEPGTTHWNAPNYEACNCSNFTALPGGYRNAGGSFGSGGTNGYWWTATEYDAPNSWYRILNYSYAQVNRRYINKKYGFSVRCVKD